MRSIKISELVWKEIAARGKFGETEDDVLRRVFDLPPITTSEKNASESLSTFPTQSAPENRQPRRSFATQRMSCYVARNQLHISFQGGTSQDWQLPSKNNKSEIRTVRDKAVSFAREQGATIGQVNAVKKALTDNGYHLTK